MKNSIILFFVAVTLLGFSCSTVKHLPKDEVYYKGFWMIEYNKVESEEQPWKVNEAGDKAVNGFLTIYMTPNGAILGLPMFRVFPIRLWLYNLFYTEKTIGVKRWFMDNFGEPPKTISMVSPELRAGKVANMLENMGHFGAEGKAKLTYNKKGNKARVRYIFNLPQAYTYRNIALDLDSTHVEFNESVEAYMQNNILKPGIDFNLSDINDEKEALFEFLRDRGHYGLKINDILVLADTTVGYKQVDLRILIDPASGEEPYKKYFVDAVMVKIDTAVNIDSMQNVVFVKSEDAHVRKRTIATLVTVAPKTTYSFSKTRQSIANLSSAGIFKESRINYVQNNPADSAALMAEVNLKTSDKVTLNFEGDVGIKSSGFIGPSVDMIAQRRNIFGGAENLTVKLSGFLDFPTGVYREKVSNTFGYSVTTSLKSPVIKTPFKWIPRQATAIPFRDISLSYEYIIRPDLFTFVSWNASYSLLWQSSRSVRHKLDVLNFNYTDIPKSTSDFDSLLSESPQARISYSDQFILGSGYTFTYDNRWNERKRFNHYYSGGVELAGNTMGLLTGSPKQEAEVFGVKFSQYVILKSETRFFKKVGRKGSVLAFRNIVNFGIPIGNSQYMPFIKQFYVGGSNSLRPFTARTVGPGRYLEFDESAVNQVADIKIETNLEYRFRIAYVLYGAIWSDLGNIWLLREDPTRPDTQFRPGKILPDSYLTSGIGLRLDLSYLVLRADFGALLYLPIFPKGYRWSWQLPIPITSLMGPSFGIGYPF